MIFTDQEVRDLHDEYGIGYFKIVGRGVAFQTVLEAYAYYLVRPKYREDVKRMVMRAAVGAAGKSCWFCMGSGVCCTKTRDVRSEPMFSCRPL